MKFVATFQCFSEIWTDNTSKVYVIGKVKPREFIVEADKRGNAISISKSYQNYPVGEFGFLGDLAQIREATLDEINKLPDMLSLNNEIVQNSFLE